MANKIFFLLPMHIFFSFILLMSAKAIIALDVTFQNRDFTITIRNPKIRFLAAGVSVCVYVYAIRPIQKQII